MRLSRKADDKVGALTHYLSESVRKVAAKIAEDRGAEFADEDDVKVAYAAVIVQISQDIQGVIAASETPNPEKPT